MAPPTHITVMAPEGRLTPIHPSDGVEPGGRRMYAEPGIVRRVRWSQTIRRAVNRGDLGLVNAKGEPVKTIAEAACPDELPGELGGNRLDLRAAAAPGPDLDSLIGDAARAARELAETTAQATTHATKGGDK